MPAVENSSHHREHLPKLWEEAHSRLALKNLLSAALAEFFCTASFVFVATAAVTSGCHTGDTAAQSGSTEGLERVVPGSCFLGSSNLTNIALAFGLSIFVLVYAAASFSGGHLNTAVTFAMLLARRISLLRALTYLVCQLAGALLGSALTLGVDPSGFRAALGAANRRNEWASIGSALGVEIILTALLVFVVFAAVDQARAASNAHLSVLAPFAIGVMVFLCHIVAVPIDGCSVNPARSFGTAVVAQVWQDHWIFWLGPFIGAAGAGLAYEHMAHRANSLLSPRQDTMAVKPNPHQEFTV